jgi:Fe-S cluster assembly protein SufD
MLSPRAQVDSKPELEIDADDVKGAHGATIGQIDPEHLFYLQARAIPHAQAMQMLARGFAMDVVFKIQNTSLRKKLADLVDAKFSLIALDGPEKKTKPAVRQDSRNET